MYNWEASANEVDGYSDANWGGCRIGRKSTSGGAVLLGSHLIRTWAKTQSTIALSSAESELFGGVKTACETLGMAALLKDLGQIVKLRMHMDASAALGIMQRRGVGKVRHLATGTLWLQEQELRKILEIKKVPGSDNVADIFTKNLGQAIMEKHLTSMNLHYRQGRASAAVHLHAVSRLKRELRQVKAEISAIADKKTHVKQTDQWEHDQCSRTWTRVHRSSRSQMFTPLNHDNGPTRSSEVGGVRTTIGSFICGGDFVKMDRWACVKQPDKKLCDQWHGVTVFSDKELSDNVVSAIRQRLIACQSK